MLWPNFGKKRAYLLAAILIAFLATFCILGYKVAPDSNAYINSTTYVSPLYCVLIDLFQLLFGEESFVVPLVVFQNILIAYAIFSLVSFVVDSSNLRLVHGYVLSLGFYLLFLLQTVFTVQGRIPSNTIMSEALAFPLYFLFFKYMFASVLYLRKPNLAVAAALCFLLINTRGQLAWTVLLMIGVTVYVGVKRFKRDKPANKVRVRFLFGVVFIAAVFFCASVLLPRVYNQYKNGRFTGNTLGRVVVLTSVVYVSDKEDGLLFAADEMEREVFDSTYQFMDEGKRQAAYAPRGLLSEFFHYETYCDPIQAHIHEALASTSAGMTDSEVNAKLDHMILTLGHDNFARYIRHYSVNAFGGLVRSVLLLNKPLTAIALILYLLDGIALVAFRKNPTFAGISKFSVLCLLCIGLNVLFTSFGVWCLSRYMFYNFPLFYTGMYVMFVLLCRSFLANRPRASGTSSSSRP